MEANFKKTKKVYTVAFKLALASLDTPDSELLIERYREILKSLGLL